jgi:hypothetical protein
MYDTHVTHADYLQLVDLLTFQTRHSHFFSGMIVFLILDGDPMFFRPFCLQKCTLSLGYLQIFLCHNQGLDYSSVSVIYQLVAYVLGAGIFQLEILIFLSSKNNLN